MAGYMDLIGKAGDLIGKAGGSKKKGRGNRPEHLAHGGDRDSDSASSMVNDNRSQTRNNAKDRFRRTDRG